MRVLIWPTSSMTQGLEQYHLTHLKISLIYLLNLRYKVLDCEFRLKEKKGRLLILVEKCFPRVTSLLGRQEISLANWRGLLCSSFDQSIRQAQDRTNGLGVYYSERGRNRVLRNKSFSVCSSWPKIWYFVFWVLTKLNSDLQHKLLSWILCFIFAG